MTAPTQIQHNLIEYYTVNIELDVDTDPENQKY